MSTPKEKTVMLGARISPKAQYGLRLLARIQGRTIAEAVEWAINLAMRTTRVGAGIQETRLYKVVDAVWDRPSEPRQIYYLDENAPELLDFDQRSAWGLVKRCKDLWKVTYYAFISNDENEPPEQVEVDSSDASMSEKYPIFETIEKHWEQIRGLGVELVQIGELEAHYTLQEILDGTARSKAGIV